jgi:ABC-type lipoprotein release transport system permease subunit
MTPATLALRGLAHYWRSHLAVVLGVATAVSVLTGALLVGDSVRGSLRGLVEDRLGHADQAVVSTSFFREALAADLAADEQVAARVSSLVPLVVAQGFVTAQESGRRVGEVAVYGVDDRFWQLHGMGDVTGPTTRDALLSPALASDLGVNTGDAVLVRLQRPSAVPLESLHAKKDDLGRTVRVTAGRVLPRRTAGEFTLRPQQGDVRAIFLSLSRLQRELEVPSRANTIIASLRASDGAGGVAGTGDDRVADTAGDTARQPALDALLQGVRRRATLEDVGVRVRPVAGQPMLAVESPAGLLDPRQEAAARQAIGAAGLGARPLFTYLANTVAVDGREVPYSLVTALDLASVAPAAAGTAPGAPPSIVLNDWAARDLGAIPGSQVRIEYYLWEDPGRLVTKSATFTLAAVVPVAAGDRAMAPEYPGITDSPTLDEWNPPFPVDLRRVRPLDEAYWRDYRTTPKAFIALEDGQRLWRTRYGAVTSIRVPVADAANLVNVQRALEAGLRERLDPAEAGLAVRDVRAEALQSSRGATDFGEYFTYFSFFLVVSALLLAVLFFKLGIEQRLREVGLLRAVGFSVPQVRGVFLREGAVLALVGGLVGTADALGYAWLVMTGLRTWWVDAVGTTALEVHVRPLTLVAGFAGGFVAAMVCIWWTLRSLSRVTERSLLAGEMTVLASGPAPGRPRRATGLAAVVLAFAGLALVAGGLTGRVEQTAGFFGAGAALLAAALTAVAWSLGRRTGGQVAGRGWTSLARLGLRNVSYRPSRAVLSMAVVAAAAFVLVTVGAFRRGPTASSADPHSGTGGYSILVDSLLPIVTDLSSPAGRQDLGLSLPDGVRIERFRVLPGDDASCLNLYAPSRPRILGAPTDFLREGRFTFGSSLPGATDAERANPWLLLERTFEDGAIPVVADANSLMYVLHTPVGGDFVIDDNGQPMRLRVVGALKDSVLQGEFIMAEPAFLRNFPAQQGYGFLLLETPPAQIAAVEHAIENALVDFGADARGTAERLDEYHRVENTYLSTFQTLGGLGLLLGTVGVAAVLLRNVLERRRELALLGAVGFRRAHFLAMAFVESAALVAAGLVAGGATAWLAVAPALAERGVVAPIGAAGLLLLAAVLVIGLVSAWVAVRATLRTPLLESLRSE